MNEEKDTKAESALQEAEEGEDRDKAEEMSEESREEVEEKVSGESKEEVEEKMDEESKEEVEEKMDESLGEETEKETKDETEKKCAQESKEEWNEELSLEEGTAEELEPELQALDGEDLEEESESEKEAKSGKIIAVLKKLGIGVAVLLIGAYVGFAVYFMNHFAFHTVVNGIDVSMKSVKQVESSLKQQVKDYNLVLKELDGKTEVISGTEIAMTYEKGDAVSGLVESQNPWLWPVSLFQEQELQVSVGVSYDEEKLAEVVAKLDCMKEDEQIAPVSATPKYNGTEFEIEPEQPGTQIDEEAFLSKLEESLHGFVAELDLNAEGCYVSAEYGEDSPEVIALCEEMNQYLTAKITYVLGSEKEVVDRDEIQEWLIIKDAMNVSLSAKKIKEYVAELAEKYDTYGKSRTFTSAGGRTVTVSGGNYGWKIDQDAEYKALVENVKNHEVVEREPEYSSTAASHNGVEWGSTYVEVDLTNQKVYLIKDGSVILDTPCVTGNTSKGWITPEGVYSIRYLKKDAVLRGPKKNGVYEWESPVTFWMPFNGAIGLHDASWQTSFGNPEGYLITGSRGCVNLQYDAAKVIFENVSAGTPVICYF